jgi:hypothetical protein
MRWCLRVKFVQHRAEFGHLLMATGDAPIVEESHRDVFWGARPSADGLLIGSNVLGRLLMELRRSLDRNELSEDETLALPSVPHLRICDRPIGALAHSATREDRHTNAQLEWTI